MVRFDDITPEQAEAVARLSLDVFTTMVNAGFTFAEALSAIYLTGASHALDVITNRQEAT